MVVQRTKITVVPEQRYPTRAEKHLGARPDRVSGASAGAKGGVREYGSPP